MSQWQYRLYAEKPPGMDATNLYLFRYHKWDHTSAYGTLDHGELFWTPYESMAAGSAKPFAQINGLTEHYLDPEEMKKFVKWVRRFQHRHPEVKTGEELK